MDLLTHLQKEAKNNGFEYSDGVDYHSALSYLNEHSKRYRSWLGKNYHGKMSYLERGLEFKEDPRKLFSELQSVFCILSPYDSRPVQDGDGKVSYARYLRGEDYHKSIKKKLEIILNNVKNKYFSENNKQLEWKICVDTSAVLERMWAYLSGLGWIGKNTMLINPKIGSYFFIGIVYLNVKLNKCPTLLPNYCGNCKKCLDFCPTGAFEKEKVLNAKKCISYLTLEKRGIFNEDQKILLSKNKTWIAGCDVCQEVCPFNIKPSRNAFMQFEYLRTIDGIKADALVTDISVLINEGESQFKDRVKNSSLKRVKYFDFSRNLILLIKNKYSNSDDHFEIEKILESIKNKINIETNLDLKEKWKSLSFDLGLRINFLRSNFSVVSVDGASPDSKKEKL